MRGLLICLLIVLLGAPACRTDGKGQGPPIPASSDPKGKDLILGAIVAAWETKANHVRLYKIVKIKYFPPPMGDELEFVAYNETGKDFQHAADLYRKGGLTVALAPVRVPRTEFVRNRKYRVLTTEPVTAADLSAKRAAPPARQR